MMPSVEAHEMGLFLVGVLWWGEAPERPKAFRGGLRSEFTFYFGTPNGAPSRGPRCRHVGARLEIRRDWLGIKTS
jgi:hypothetical protein